MPPLLPVLFAFGATGPWLVERIGPVCGESLPHAARLSVIEGPQTSAPPGTAWMLRGTTSNPRYTNRSELDGLGARQEGLGRPLSRRAALIPIRKTEEWWPMAQAVPEIVPNFMAEMAKQGAIGFAECRSPPLTLGVVGFM